MEAPNTFMENLGGTEPRISELTWTETDNSE